MAESDAVDRSRLTVFLVQQGGWDMPLESMPLASGYLEATALADDHIRDSAEISIENFRGGVTNATMANAMFADGVPDVIAFSVLGWKFRAFAGPRALDHVDGISFQRAGTTVTTADRARIDLETIASPVLTGAVDLTDDHGNFRYDVALMETNRGCPYKCASASCRVTSTSSRPPSTRENHVRGDGGGRHRDVGAGAVVEARSCAPRQFGGHLDEPRDRRAFHGHDTGRTGLLRVRKGTRK